MPKQLTSQIIEAAIKGYEAQKAEIDSEIAELRSMLDSGIRMSPAAMPSETGRPRKKFSAASRRKMAAAQRARYAKLRGESEPTEAVAAKPGRRKRRKMSAAGKAAIAAAVKKRWAAIRAGKKVA